MIPTGTIRTPNRRRRLSNLVSDHIAPRLMPNIEGLSWRQTQVLAVRAYPSPSRPHYLKKDGPERGVSVRVGSTNRRADAALIEQMRRSRQPWAAGTARRPSRTRSFRFPYTSPPNSTASCASISVKREPDRQPVTCLLFCLER
jgi:hypothetical protein